ncbi:N-acetyl-gamma-glutamyl-phosphate reductase [Hyphobacterium sp. SN044]|uniref:N-acetyl-gamma-glutamyl-phosphate reductase n=1 Tax=Hyphobacterium sp. SN044 TaxID=2912575 RepID=UPI001F018E3E|nr:N-acetyl-gamma-glutamyl-phosphate reductase [Hyphobacterium sp. SN044]MCF8879532.1 N-acetyl-gamma-glutamyl-phosphate reductase [Hyphobacterium sp. SN044]
MSVTIGLVGARGHTGRHLLRLLAGRNDMRVVCAGSREFAGQAVTTLAPEADPDLIFEALTPEDVAGRGLDAVILALPNGAAAPYVAAIDAASPGTVIVDLSADYRFDENWVYGLPEIYGRDRIRGATRIANPGCYATAGQLAIAPLRDVMAGTAHVFGVSGYSGAGTTPSRKNDTEALQDNLMPYALTGHLHEGEMARHTGVPVAFTPHVAEFFQGLTATVQFEFAAPLLVEDIRVRYETAFGGEPLIRLIDAIPEIRDGAHFNGAVLGGFAVSKDGMRGVTVCALDNLLKGAAVQAVQNLAIATGLPEFDGLI